MVENKKFKKNWGYAAVLYALPLALQGCPQDVLPPEAFAAVDVGEMRSGETKIADIFDIVENYDGQTKIESGVVDVIEENDVQVMEEMPQIAEVEAEILVKDSALEDLVVTPIKPYTKDEHCVALFHFEVSAPFEDSCNGLKLNNYNTNETGSLKEFGKARMFDGKAYLELPDAALLKVKIALTLEAMVKPQIMGKSYEGKYGMIITKEDFYEGYFLKVEEGKVTGGAMLSDGKIHTVSSAYVLPTDTFTHLAFTYDGAKMKLYVERKLVAEELAQGTVVYKTNKSVFIGLNAYENGFKGAIDEVRVSDVARDF